MYSTHHADWRVRAALVAIAALAIPVPNLHAQGATTAAIQGLVRATDGSDVEGARVEVLNTATGFVVAGEVRHGRFLVQGLEIGGPYTITVARLGLQLQRIEDVYLRLGEARDLAFILTPDPIAVDTLRAVTRAPFPDVNAHGGTATTIPDSLLHRLPSLDRDLYDFVRLVPQISTRTAFAGGGMSGGGVGLRFNDFLIDGSSERTTSGGLTSNQNGGQSVPLDAVRPTPRSQTTARHSRAPASPTAASCTFAPAARAGCSDRNGPMSASSASLGSSTKTTRCGLPTDTGTTRRSRPFGPAMWPRASRAAGSSPTASAPVRARPMSAETSYTGPSTPWTSRVTWFPPTRTL